MAKSPFLGGSDSGRSRAVAANRLINLFPMTSQGGVSAFYGWVGLTAELFPGSIASGIYTAANGRCFAVIGAVLYEVINTLGILSLTSRGAITSATVSRMTDNGFELIIVNGTDGWIFTFATNDLREIKIAQATSTVTIATPAVFTKTGHGFAAGDAISLTTTRALPTGAGTLPTAAIPP